jgi:hypothetical protein
MMRCHNVLFVLELVARLADLWFGIAQQSVFVLELLARLAEATASISEAFGRGVRGH